MHSADPTDSKGAPVRASGNLNNLSGSRRAAIRAALAAPVAYALAGAAHAAPSPAWRAADWLTRWQRLGCGAELSAQGHPILTPRIGDEWQNALCSEALVELSGPGRMAAIAAAMSQVIEIVEECPAERCGRELDHVMANWRQSDPSWIAEVREAERRLEQAIVRTPRGLAAKLKLVEVEAGTRSERVLDIVAYALEHML